MLASPSRSRPAPGPAHRPPPPSQLLIPATQIPAPDCLGIPLRFHVTHYNIDVHGYQMYAVEKWCVERNRVSVLLVYTGDPAHKVSVFAIKPNLDLSPADARTEWDNALAHLRRDGARPKETPHGVLMATSLAHFRSDYTIVLIPDGNFLAVRDQLYTNINLLRMGCSGRSALTLEDPSDATKSRFISTYRMPHSISNTSAVTSTETLALPSPITKSRSHSHSHSSSVLNFTKYTSENPAVPPNSKAKQTLGLETRSSYKKPTTNSTFIATVLELVKLIQAALSLFGMYPVILTRLDGLLCDETVDGIRRWIIQIGQPCVGLEPMERIADPMFISALISLVLTVRNKLAAIGLSNLVPKDPFLQPHLFICALTTYVQSTNPASSNPTIAPQPTHQDPFLGPSSIQFPSSLYHLFSTSHPTHQLTPSTSSSSGTTPAPAPTVLTRELVDAIALAYEGKAGTADARGGGGRVRRALRDKLRAGIDSDTDLGPTSAATSGGEGGGSSGIGIGIGIVGGDHNNNNNNNNKDREREREKETLGGVGTAVGSSGGQILSGIGSFASGLGLGVGPGASGVTGAGAIVEATDDLGWLIRCVFSRDGRGKGKTKTRTRTRKKTRRGDERDLLGVGYGGYAYGLGLGVGYGYGAGAGAGKEKEKDGGVGLSVRALWGGEVNLVVMMREWEAERERDPRVVRRKTGQRERDRDRDRGALSDGDVDDSAGALAKSETEEESDAAMQQSFRGMWGERMQRKLGSWAGLHRRRGAASVDLRGENGLSMSPQSDAPPATARPDMVRGKSMTVSPLLPPIVFSGVDGEPDDDDLLSSGQVSPIDISRPGPFSLFPDGQHPLDHASRTTSEYERKVTEFNQRRRIPIPQNRISSWADPFSARELLDDEESDLDGRRRRPGGDVIGSLVGGASVLSSEVMSEIWEDLESSREHEGLFRRKQTFGPQRRRSFHDVDSLRGMRVIPIDHMRVDVELAGQLLIFTRREEHLQNVIACLQVITSTLTTTNTQLREDYTTHAQLLSELDTHAQVISAIDAENAKADKTAQATHTLRYEAEQFRVPDLWHAAMPSRQKVLALREKVFGTGGRRLPPGVRGAHGRFNRLQWTLDGRERLVDHLGRTESEAEEEEPGVQYLGIQEEDGEGDVDVVQHPAIRPMWLLHFFTSWGARWGLASSSQSLGDASKVGTTQSTSGVAEGRDGSGLTRRGNRNPSSDSMDGDDESISPVSISSP